MSKEVLQASFNDVIKDIFDNYNKYDSSKRASIKSVLAQVEDVNKYLDKHDGFLMNLFDNFHRNFHKLLQLMDTSILGNNDKNHLTREFQRLTKDILREYNKYKDIESDVLMVEEVLGKMLLLNQTLEYYDKTVWEKATESFNKFFGVK